jgi:hypothetical protein
MQLVSVVTLDQEKVLANGNNSLLKAKGLAYSIHNETAHNTSKLQPQWLQSLLCEKPPFIVEKTSITVIIPYLSRTTYITKIAYFSFFPLF